jgi:hypothetical protein
MSLAVMHQHVVAIGTGTRDVGVWVVTFAGHVAEAVTP